jgi:rRNA small subunit pseudouridine methyltransferase Nep1
VFGLSVQGKQEEVPEFAADVNGTANPCVVVGGFPRGHFSSEVLNSLDELVRIDARPLEAHVVASRVAYEIEKAERGIND